MCDAGDESVARQRFNEFVEAITSEKDGMPEEVLSQILAGMEKKFNSPPIGDLEVVLGRAVPAEKAQQFLFWPDEDDMRLYPDMLASPPDGSPDTHPQAKMQILALTLLYLVHARCWERTKPFIEAGGLLRLVDLVSHPNLYLASQAMQCLLHATDEEMFPWHDPPVPEGRNMKEGPDALVWKRMFELSRSALIPNILRHQNPDTYPGSGLMALRLMAFIASWLRYHFTKDRVLRLSAGLLQLLKEWSMRQGVSDEEKLLAQQLFDDFSRYPPAVADAAPQLGSGIDGSELTSVVEDDQEEEEGVTTQEKTQVNHVEPRESDAMRQAGNDAYRQGDFTQAIHHYSLALDLPVPASDLITEGPRRASLLSNRAGAYLARAAAGGGRTGADDVGLLEGIDLGETGAREKHYEAALLDAQGALDLEPTHLKATFRKAQALYWLARYPRALDTARSAKSLATSQSSGGAFVTEVDALCAEIERCMATPSAGDGNGLEPDLKDAALVGKKEGVIGGKGQGSIGGGPEALLTLSSGNGGKQGVKSATGRGGKLLIEEISV